MKTAIHRRDPEIQLYFPIWYHGHGRKMYVERFDRKNHTLIISGSAAKVVIKKASSVYSDVKGWLVDWEVVQFRPYEEGVLGRTHFDDDDLAAAFGLSDDSDEFGDWLIERYGADSAAQGKYIRWRDFLNIPCPGTGGNGDPNISIDLDDEIRNAVRQLLA